jgi:hypothetical protein
MAIMGVSVYGCDQLYQLLVQAFMAVDGDSNWVDFGVDAVPERLKALTTLCKKLALTPWDSSIPTHLSELLSSKLW